MVLFPVNPATSPVARRASRDRTRVVRYPHGPPVARRPPLVALLVSTSELAVVDLAVRPLRATSEGFGQSRCGMEHVSGFRSVAALPVPVLPAEAHLHLRVLEVFRVCHPSDRWVAVRLAVRVRLAGLLVLVPRWLRLRLRLRRVAV